MHTHEERIPDKQPVIYHNTLSADIGIEIPKRGEPVEVQPRQAEHTKVQLLQV